MYGYDPSEPKPKPKKQSKKKAKQGVDALGDQLAATSVAEPPLPPTEPEWKELPFVTLPAPEEGASSSQGEWFIRASQGHTLKLDDSALLAPVLDDEEGRARAGLMVHGTQWKLWDILSE